MPNCLPALGAREVLYFLLGERAFVSHQKNMTDLLVFLLGNMTELSNRRMGNEWKMEGLLYFRIGNEKARLSLISGLIFHGLEKSSGLSAISWQAIKQDMHF